MCLISPERDHLFSFDLLQLHPSHIIRKEKNCISSHQKRRQTCIFEIPLNEHSNLHISQNSTIFNYMQPRCKRIKVQLLRNAGSTPIDILHNMAKDLWWLKVVIKRTHWGLLRTWDFTEKIWVSSQKDDNYERFLFQSVGRLFSILAELLKIRIFEFHILHYCDLGCWQIKVKITNLNHYCRWWNGWYFIILVMTNIHSFILNLPAWQITVLSNYARMWDFSIKKHCQRHNGPRNWLRDLD